MTKKEMQKKLLTTLYIFKKCFQRNTFKLQFDSEKEKRIVFPIDSFLDYTKLRDIVIIKTSCKDNIRKIIKSVYNNYIRGSKSVDYDLVEEKCDFFGMVYPLTLNNVHSFFTSTEGVFLLTQTERGLSLLRLKNIKRNQKFNKYAVVDIMSPEKINEFLTNPNVAVSMPISSKYIKYIDGGAKNREIRYSLSEEQYEKRMNSLRNFIYDCCEEQEDLDYQDFVERVPIIRG